MNILLDTHAFYWWLTGDAALSAGAREWIERCDRGEAVLGIPVVTLWELEWKRRLGKLPFRCPLREVWPEFRAMAGVAWVVPDAMDWLLAAELDWKHRDPADRLVAAAALNRAVPVLTKDRAFHEAGSPVEAVW